MLTSAPGAPPLTDAPLAFVRSRARALARTRHAADVSTLPLIDVLLVLLLFLLSLFDAQGDGLCVHQAIDLPEAAHGIALGVAPVISIDPSYVSVDGYRVGDTSDWARPRDARIAANLREALTTLRRDFAILHPDKPLPDRVIVRAARNLSYGVLRKVLSACAQAGFPGVSFAVEQGSLARR